MATGDVAWDGSTRSARPAPLLRKQRGVLYSQTTNMNYTTQTRDASYALAPNATYSTGDDIIRIPFRENKDLLIAVLYSQPTTNLPYPGLIIQRPSEAVNPTFGYSTKSPANKLGASGSQATSTKDQGWTMLVSTAAIASNASSMAVMVTWQLHPGRFAQCDGASTGTGTNAYENYVVVAPIMTAAQGNVDTMNSTQFVSLQCSSFGYNIAHVMAFEIDA